MVVVHCPESNLKLGSGVADVPAMLADGLTVALGTDGAASNNNLNMMEEMHLVSLLHKGVHREPTLLSPHEVLAMATVNGARLQGRADTGVLAVGMKADVIAVDMDRPHLVPNTDPLSNLLYSAQGGDVGRPRPLRERRIHDPGQGPDPLRSKTGGGAAVGINAICRRSCKNRIVYTYAQEPLQKPVPAHDYSGKGV